jgi:Protein of unknown function (DUF2550)
MLIALLALLGVNLIVIVILVGLLFARKRWLMRQPGEFVGAIRVTSGRVDGLGADWKRGYGRWVRDVLVWTKAPLMVRQDLVPVDRLAGEHAAAAGEVKRLGDNPAVVAFSANGATIEIAAKAEHRRLVMGPFTTSTADASDEGT